MGRGRAKAKQVKVARRLKYNSGGTDLDRLREELSVNHKPQDDHDPYDEESYDDDDLADRYADYVEDDDEDDDDRR